MPALPKKLVAITVIVAAVLAAYANGLRGPFVFDDASSITTNPTIRHLWPLTAPLSPPRTNVTAQGRPVLNLSLAVNYALGGTEVRGYHAVNVAIHALAALALFGLVRRTLAGESGGGLQPQYPPNHRLAADATGIAAVGALLWAVHPLHTESVTYVIQRAESLMGLFYLATLYFFRRGWLALSVAACALGMATKEVMVTAPLMVLCYDRTFGARSFGEALRRRWGFYAALAGTWLLLGWLVAQGGGNRGGSVGFGAGIEPWAYWLTQFRAIATYLRLACWPAPLVFEYGTFWVTGAGEIAVEAALVLALLALTVRGLWRRSAGGFAGAWFFGLLAPTSLAPGTTQMIVEHRMYLPLAAVAVLAATGLHAQLGRRAGWAGLAAAVALGLATARRNLDYRSDLALWGDTVAQRPANPLAHFMLAEAHAAAGDTPRALASYAEALRLKPDFPVGHEKFGELLLRHSRRAEAVGHFEAALRLQPEFADAHANLGNALLAGGDAAGAARHLAEAGRLAPGFFETHYNFANALAAAGRPEEAVAQYRLALALKPAAAEAQFNLGNSLAELGRSAEAIAAYHAATGTRPGYAAAHYNLGNALARAGRPAEAVAAYEAALRARPDYAEAHHNLGSALSELGRLAEAAGHYEETLRLAPDFPKARANLDRVRAQRRR